MAVMNHFMNSLKTQDKFLLAKLKNSMAFWKYPIVTAVMDGSESLHLFGPIEDLIELKIKTIQVN